MTSLLKGTAFITGAASGIGQHTARSFAKYGIQRLALADINTKLLDSSIKSLQKQFPGIEVLPLQMNVRKASEVKSGIAETVQRFGRLDVAVNNAGIGGTGVRTHEVDEEEWSTVLDVDLHGVWRCQKEELAIMLEQQDFGYREGRGRIINVASMYGVISPHMSIPATAYTAAKHGVIGLTRGDGNGYAQHGIRINAICPGFIETPLLNTSGGSDANSVLGKEVRKAPIQRIGKMEEIGDAITFLASPLGSFMQSAALVADGGFSTQ
ncbi:hypothetical protein PFICI_13725 [Pestalotiopsis fici W106-1]|uniref:Uncharacterized protein n=1 Tax=Pestalotiopsis fici (strain W106-1 / CGMCC3.15140) TaxID=1229662 RepID=W3WR02_PESFW|nr:uncharacterized protein PFICI_13725 [Pestalotiopsis fici W106-1]ETS75241.1 hypothetical protein PFICI_13725 [Pestalotiopsis fici W106-1]